MLPRAERRDPAHAPLDELRFEFETVHLPQYDGGPLRCYQLPLEFLIPRGSCATASASPHATITAGTYLAAAPCYAAPRMKAERLLRAALAALDEVGDPTGVRGVVAAALASSAPLRALPAPPGTLKRIGWHAAKLAMYADDPRAHTRSSTSCA